VLVLVVVIVLVVDRSALGEQPRFYPWFAGVRLGPQLFLYVAVFGVPLGLLFAYFEARRGGTTRSLAPR
jgi:hypothetical protein